MSSIKIFISSTNDNLISKARANTRTINESNIHLKRGSHEPLFGEMLPPDSLPFFLKQTVHSGNSF